MGNERIIPDIHIPIGALVRVFIIKRREDLAIVVDKNVGLLENCWYMVHSLSTGKEYMAYPNEVLWLTKPESDGESR
jgi:hypothetical protein